MRNPWAELPDRAPYVLKSDAATVSAFNRVAGSKTRLRTHILPEPFLGKPRTARVLLLQLNPGFAGSEVRWHQRPDFARVLRANLTHSACDCANPYLDPSPALARSPGGTWWRSRLRRVIEEVGDASRVARRLAVVEFHGYHSPNFRLLPVTLPSQRYGFWLVRRAIERDAVVIVMRGRDLWRVAVPELDARSRVFTPTTPRSAYLTERTLGRRGSSAVVEALS